MFHNLMVFGTLSPLNSRAYPTTSTPKMVLGRYDPVHEEGSQDYPLPYILARMLPKPQHGGIPQVAGTLIKCQIMRRLEIHIDQLFPRIDPSVCESKPAPASSTQYWPLSLSIAFLSNTTVV